MEVLAWIRRNPHVKSIPVIILTSSREPSDIQRAYALGASSYLVRPVDFNELLEMLKVIGTFWRGLNHTPDRIGEGSL